MLTRHLVRLSPVFVFPAALLFPSALRAQVTLTPAEGYAIAWNGNEADHFTDESPAPVPDNLALAVGAEAFTSGDLGPELGIAYHQAFNLNDGQYGNAFSWIGGASAEGGVPFAAIRFAAETPVARFAFGRDNGDAVADTVATGQFADRTAGLYTVQITRVASPDVTTAETGDAATGWVTVGTLDYGADEDTEKGGGFTARYRHEYEIRATGGAIPRATALRLLVPATGIATGTDIDEIEVYSTGGLVFDSDGDGFNDTVEVALGFNPNDKASTPESLSTIVTAAEFRFHAARNVKYSIEESADLKVWNAIETGIVGRGEAVTRLYSVTGQAKRYFRAIRE